jgi:hypothetical protein
MFVVNLPSSSSPTSSAHTATTASAVFPIKRSQRIATRTRFDTWSVDDVCAWVREQLRWSDVRVDAFRANQIDGAVLTRLTRDELAELLGHAPDDADWAEFTHHVRLLLPSNTDVDITASSSSSSTSSTSSASVTSVISINDALDDTVLARVLDRLSFTSFTTVTRVCRRWHRLFHSARLWMPLCLNSWRRMGSQAVTDWSLHELMHRSALTLRDSAPLSCSLAPVFVVHGLTTLRFAVNFLTREVRLLYAALADWAAASPAADIADALAGRDASAYAADRADVPRLRRLTQQWLTLYDFLQVVCQTCVCLLRHHIVLHALEFDAVCQSLYLLHVRLRLCDPRLALGDAERREHAALVICRQPFPYPVRVHDRLASIVGVGPLEVRLALSPFVQLVDESVALRVVTDHMAHSCDVLVAKGAAASIGAHAPARFEQLVFKQPYQGRLRVRCEGVQLSARSADALVPHVVPSATVHAIDLQCVTAPLIASAGDSLALVAALGALIQRVAFTTTHDAQPYAHWNVLVQAINGAFVRSVRPVAVAARGLSKEDIDYLHARFFERRRNVTVAMFQRFWDWFGPVLHSLRYRRHMATLWASGFISGLVTRHETDRRLSSSGLVVGTFCLRFSESEPGAITISKVAVVAAQSPRGNSAPLPSIRHYVINEAEYLTKHTLPSLLLTDESLVDILQERHVSAFDVMMRTDDDISDLILDVGGDPDDAAALLARECSVEHEPECRAHMVLQKRSKKQVLRQFWRADQLRATDTATAGNLLEVPAAQWQVASDEDLGDYHSIQSLQDLVFV